MHDYGGCIFEHAPFSQHGRSGATQDDVFALEGIAVFIERGAFEFVLSENSLREVQDRADRRYLLWAFDVLDHWEACITEAASPFSGRGLVAAKRLDESPDRFGYLSEKDRALLRDAVALECDTFLTIERKLPANADHLGRILGIQVVRPPELWKPLRPHMRGL
jgi:hypothetical protein